MRASGSVRGSASVKTTSTKHGGKAELASTRRTTAPTVDEKDDYIVNLKGSIYLLSIENEMLKKAVNAPARGGGSGGGVGPSGSPLALSRGGPPPTTAALTSSELPPAEYPSEIGDAFEMMRQKYTQLEHKYQHDLEEARRGAEALASQCAAQSSLIGTLKREVAQGAAVLADQKAVVQRVEQKAASDLELSQCDIKHLHGRIQELMAEKATLVLHIESQATAIADLKSAAASAVHEAQSAEFARARALDSYARQMLATRVLVTRWRRELAEKRAAVAAFDGARAEKAAAEKRASRAEAEAAKERASAAAAAAVQVDLLEAAAEERRKLTAALEAVRAELGTTAAALGASAANLRLLDDQLPATATRLESVTGSLVKTEATLAATQQRAGELERLLAAKSAEADALRGAAVLAEERQRSAIESMRRTEKALADANARVGSQANELRQLTATSEAQASEVEKLGQEKAVSVAEVATLKDELSRRPPIDVIQELDVENLLQRNVQAASAMQRLLAWKSAHAPQPLSVGLQPPPADVE